MIISMTKSYCGDFLPDPDLYSDGYESPEILPQSTETHSLPKAVDPAGNSSPRRQSFGRDISNNGQDRSLLILEEIQKTNSSLQDVSSRIEDMDKRLKSVEDQQKLASTPSSSADTDSNEKRKRTIPPRVRGEVRTLYRTLCEDEEFVGFDTKKRFADKENQEVVKRLCSEMSTLDASISGINVRDASRRFFQSKVEEENLKRKGKYSDKVKRTRQRNQITRKLDLRTSTLLKVQMPDDQRKLAQQVLIKEFMSSECSETETMEDGSERPVIAVKPLPWRGAKASRLIKRLDTRAKKKMSKQSVQQTLPRVTGESSNRPKPATLPDGFWGFVAP